MSGTFVSEGKVHVFEGRRTADQQQVERMRKFMQIYPKIIQVYIQGEEVRIVDAGSSLVLACKMQGMFANRPSINQQSI